MRSNKLIRNAWTGVVVLLIFMLAAASGVCAQSKKPAKKIAVMPFLINSPQDLGFLQRGLFNMLFSRLSDPGKVDVLDRDTVDKIWEKAKDSDEIKGSLNESKARILGADMGVDYILFGSLTHFGDSVSLDASMVDITGKKKTLTFFEQSNKMGDVIPMVNTFAGDINAKVFNRSIANELYVRPQQQGPRAPGALLSADGMAGSRYGGGFVNLQQTGQRGFLTHLKFKGRINALAAGDVNKDGKVEIVTATDSEVFIYTLSGNKLLVDKKLEFAATHRIIALDIADINHNGFPEIFVTSLNIQREGLQSFVLEYNGSAYITLTKGISYYFRVIEENNGQKVLLGQKSAGHPFKGGIYPLTAQGKQYDRGKKLRLPRSVSVLSLAKGPVTTKDAAEYVLINENERLVIVNDTGGIDWEGNTKFGGMAHYFLLPQEDTDATYRERVYLNPRIRFFDVDEDGRKEVIAVKNQVMGSGVLGRYKHFTRGSIEMLSWNGIALAPVFKTRSIQGWISDFAIADIDGDGVDELVVAVVGKTKILTGSKGQSSNIISYKLE